MPLTVMRRYIGGIIAELESMSATSDPEVSTYLERSVSDLEDARGELSKLIKEDV